MGLREFFTPESVHEKLPKFEEFKPEFIKFLDEALKRKIKFEDTNFTNRVLKLASKIMSPQNFEVFEKMTDVLQILFEDIETGMPKEDALDKFLNHESIREYFDSASPMAA